MSSKEQETFIETRPMLVIRALVFYNVGDWREPKR